MNLGKFLWGLIVLTIGLLLIATNFGYIDPSVWGQIWRLWPIIIIISGLSIISKGLPKWTSIVFDILVIALVLGGIIYLVSQPTNNLTIQRTRNISSEVTQTTLDESLASDTKSIEYTIKTGAANLRIDGKSDQLLEGLIESNVAETNIIRQNKSNVEQVEISSQSIPRTWFGWHIKNDWNLSLNNKLPVSLFLSTGAVDCSVDLSELNLTNFDIKSGASTYDLRLGDKSDKIKGVASLGASTITIRAPKSSALKIDNNSGASSNNFTSVGLSKTADRVYETDDFDQAQKTIEIDLKTGASTIELVRY